MNLEASREADADAAVAEADPEADIDMDSLLLAELDDEAELAELLAVIEVG